MTDPLDDLLQNMPLEDASEAEIEAFMEKVMATPGGADLIKDFASKITEGGSLDTMLKEEEARLESLTLKSPARFIFRVELSGTSPLISRRLSLPADASYFHLHCALQDAFGWQDSQPHQFQVWEDGQLEVSFSLGDEEEAREDDYCEIENRIVDLFQENVFEFRYLYRKWLHRVVIEDFVPAGEKGSSSDLTPHLHD
ncbi:plasmid pRiA4b ORF-3 family protein, partial [bacterium]|nr:plasmid pRiA4b ORF-3 family protein [bacterium]